MKTPRTITPALLRSAQSVGWLRAA